MEKTLLLCIILSTSVALLLAQPNEFDFTPNNVTHGVIATVEVNGIPASNSDWIAAFDEDNNCAGAVQLLDYYSEAFCYLRVYGDDITTYNIDEGINTGETFTFKLWIAATNEILDHPTDMEPVSGWTGGFGDGQAIPGYDFSDMVILNFSRVEEVDQDMDGFFGTDDPDDNDPCNPDNTVAACDTDGDGIPDGNDPPNEFAFTPNNQSEGVIATVEINGLPASDSDWIAAFDEDNNCAGAIQLVDYYGQAFCNLQVYGDDITTTDVDEGINVNTGETFTFKLWVAATNEILDHPTDIDPVSGWEAGWSGRNIPGFGFADMVVLNFSRVEEVDEDMDGFSGTDDPDDNDPCNPDNTVAACDTDGDGIPDGNDPPNEFDFTPNNNSAGVITTVEIDGIPASGFDWIAAFDEDNNCAGAVQLIEYYDQAYCNLQVYGDDFTTLNIDEGINAGETFTFKLWVAAIDEILDHPVNINPVSGWSADLNGAPIAGWAFVDGVVLKFQTVVDNDFDGYTDADDPDDTDPCNPDNTVAVCDTDGDGTPNGSDPDNGNPCNPDNTVPACDIDNDGTPDDSDPDNTDPCNPNNTVPTCDIDNDGTPDDSDPDNTDPCNPNINVTACDIDNDGTPGDSDPDNTNPCNPDNTVAACDSDGDGIPDGYDPVTPPVEFAFTPNNTYQGILATVEINGVPASSFDWIAAFDEDGNCAGAAQLVDYYDQTFCNLQVYGDDITTTDVDEGINAGETFTFKLWVAATNEILDHPTDIDPVSGWDAGWSAPILGFGFADNVVLNFSRVEEVDEDMDGFFGTDDPDDNDPCNPDNTATVCDSDGDGIPDGNDPPTEFVFTSSPFSGGVVAIIEVNGMPASTSDWIAAFDEDGNCAGAVQLINYGELTYCNLQVYGDDFTTPNIDEGINTGETFTFKLWVAAIDEILDHPVNINPVSGWSADLNGAPIAGWAFVDGVVLKFQTVVDNDFDGYTDADDPDDTDPCNPDNTVAVCDTDGDGTPNGSDPDNGNPCNPDNTVPACDIDNDGTPDDSDPDNTDPCNPNNTVPTCDIDNDGTPDDSDPDNTDPCNPNINVTACDIDNDGTPGDSDPDNTNPCNPDNTVAACDSDGDGIPDGYDPVTPPVEFAFTPNNTYQGILATVEINGVPASSFDWIAAFDEDGNCAGAAQLVDYYDQTFCNLQVYGDDITTTDVDEGINAGETFTFKLWVAATNEILDHPTDIDPVSGWDAGWSAPIPGYDFPDMAVLNFSRNCTPPNAGSFECE